ncbi:uncharacterized protein G2W53_039414 [Senna tora]|uniref:Uncharacterized protein n=1 Tax=Senna tora TaxID=362788 RepID=A0A834SQK9_9FABA|nr:uncharacterized protein G2W53_039414 [Senna tora]
MTMQLKTDKNYPRITSQLSRAKVNLFENSHLKGSFTPRCSIAKVYIKNATPSKDMTRRGL